MLTQEEIKAFSEKSVEFNDFEDFSDENSTCIGFTFCCTTRGTSTFKYLEFELKYDPFDDSYWIDFDSSDKITKDLAKKGLELCEKVIKLLEEKNKLRILLKKTRFELGGNAAMFKKDPNHYIWELRYQERYK